VSRNAYAGVFGRDPRPLASLLVALAAFATFAAPACSSKSVASGLAAEDACYLNSDCASGLICALGACRAMCASAADCGTGGSCVDNADVAVCQSAAEVNTVCNKQSDCPAPLACASDYRCRNLCNGDTDCNVLGITGRVCAEDAQGVYFCGAPSEVSDGVLTASPPPGASTATPVLEPEGGVGVLPAPDAAVSIESVMGPGGGTLGIGAAAISVPPGALTANVPVSIVPIAAPVPGATGQAFEIEPSGTLFNAPATVTFSYANDDLGGLPPSAFAVSTVVGGAWQALPGQILDVNAQTISATTMHLSPYGLVPQVPGGPQVRDASTDDATIGVDIAPDSGGGSSIGDDSSTVFTGPPGCAASPAAAVSPPGSASGTNVIGMQGATINIQDGYAQIVESVASGALTTTYTTGLAFTFTDYPNALGYAEAGANKQGSRTLSRDGTPWISLSSMSAQQHFAAGTYSMVATPAVSGFTSTCLGQSDVFTLQGTLTISSITSTRIRGSIVGNTPPSSDAGALTVDFDIPMMAISDGGPSPFGGSNCCLP
jgi:hypothetical protein